METRTIQPQRRTVMRKQTLWLGAATATVSVGVLMGLVGSADAATLAYEGFDYTDISTADGVQTSFTDPADGSTAANATASAMNGGTGFSSTAWSGGAITNTRTFSLEAGLTFGTDFATTAGSSLRLTGSGSAGSYGVLQRPLNFNTSETTIYFGYLWQVTFSENNRRLFGTTHSSDGAFNFNSTNNLLGSPTGSEFTVTQDGSSSNTDYSPGVAVTGGSTGSSPLTIAGSITYLTLAQITNNGLPNTTITAWTLDIDDWNAIQVGGITTAELDTNNQWMRTNTFAAGLTLSGNEYFQLASHRTTTLQIDEIRYATSLNDFAVVPEPASLALLTLGSLCMLPRRRRD